MLRPWSLIDGDNEEVLMGARAQLNGAHLTGCLLLAGVVGAISGSILIALFAFLALAAIDLVAGNIRPSPQRRRH